MKTVLFYLLSTMLLIKVSDVYSQTVINYETWTPNPDCNLFGTSPIINGLQHRTVLGTPIYDSGLKAVDLLADKDGTQLKGTTFRINFNFKKGYTYKITIKASRIKGTSSSPNVKLFTDLFNSTSTTPQCSGPEFINSVGTINERSNSINKDVGQEADFIYNYTMLNSNFLYLAIGAILENNSFSTIQRVKIKKITIEETAPELVLSPTTLATTCGISTTQNFTVSNPSGLENITSYEWNLGSANNGWLYNGSPAPQNISTTANFINLKPVSNATTVRNVGVTIKVNNVNFKSYTCTVTRSTPTLTIDGPSQFCPTADFSIPNLPTGATVTWSITQPSTIATFTVANNIATVTRVGTAMGNILLNAIVDNTCGGTVVLNPVAITIGISAQAQIAGNPSVCLNNSIVLTFPQYNNAVYDWTTGPGIQITGGLGTNSITISPTNNSSITTEQVNLTVSLACGSSSFIKQIDVLPTPSIVNFRYTGANAGNPYRNELLSFEVDPLPEAIYYNWYNNNILLATTTEPYYSTFDWSCGNGDDNRIFVQAATACGLSTMGGGEYYWGMCSSFYRFSAYPNPVNDELVVERVITDEKYNQNNKAAISLPQNFTIKLYNKVGEIVCNTIESRNGKLVIDTKQLTNGMYYLHITYGKEIIKRQIEIKH